MGKISIRKTKGLEAKNLLYPNAPPIDLELKSIIREFAETMHRLSKRPDKPRGVEFCIEVRFFTEEAEEVYDKRIYELKLEALNAKGI